MRRQPRGGHPKHISSVVFEWRTRQEAIAIVVAMVTATASRSERTMEELEMTAKRCRRNRRSVWPAQGLHWRSRCWWFRLENSSDTPIFEDFSFLRVSSASRRQQFALTDSLHWKLYQMHQPVIAIFIQWYFCKTVVVFICSCIYWEITVCVIISMRLIQCWVFFSSKFSTPIPMKSLPPLLFPLNWADVFFFPIKRW